MLRIADCGQQWHGQIKKKTSNIHQIHPSTGRSVDNDSRQVDNSVQSVDANYRRLPSPVSNVGTVPTGSAPLARRSVKNGTYDRKYPALRLFALEKNELPAQRNSRSSCGSALHRTRNKNKGAAGEWNQQMHVRRRVSAH